MEHPINPLELLVRRLRTHAPLSQASVDAILALPCTMRNLEPEAYLVREAEKISVCAILVSGYAYRQKLTSDGTRQIVSLHVPGEPLDFQHLFLEVADHNVQALTTAQAAHVPHEMMRNLILCNSEIARAAMVYLSIEASIFREWVVNVGRREAKGRLAHLLCEFAIRLDTQGLSGSDGYYLPMTQEQLGDALGLTPVHVNRTIRALELEGLIKRDRRNIAFPDWKALAHVADFNTRYLHIEQH
ncbi:MAG: Crp/Fnr family transcriptional regulator [Sphingobium sp.]|uniref:Crp/Fnr family transcriptional regulator n=1 Tax=Sphingobium sp. TaxID=1912891 RepID=UPI0029A1B020|nr:Crp/Fnr family transcriptional regulator [Sphingobium sp.]MDX3911255.1 Crp/Fnr family transcriptional regulator [Sphingobium sp.]